MRQEGISSSWRVLPLSKGFGHKSMQKDQSWQVLLQHFVSGCVKRRTTVQEITEDCIIKGPAVLTRL